MRTDHAVKQKQSYIIGIHEEKNMISIIIPVYNMEKYLDACVASVVEQDYRDIEILLVDDGSKDNSLVLCHEWEKKDSRIRVFAKENGGQGSARNLALKHMKGEYVSFVDSDDLVSPDMYTALMDAINKTGADMAVSNTLKFSDGESIQVDNSEKTMCIVLSDYEAMQDRMTAGKYISDSPCNKLYHAKLFRDISFVEGRLLEDSATMYKLIDRCKKIVYIDKIGYLIRNNPTSVSRVRYNARRCDTIITFEEMVEFISKSEKYKAFTSHCISFANGAVFYNAGELYISKLKDTKTKNFIQNHAKTQLKQYKLLSGKNKALLFLVAHAFPLYGELYRIKKKRETK